MKWFPAVLMVLTGGRFQASAQKPYTLKECINYAFEHHPALAIARNNVESANQSAREAIAAYLPQVNLTMNAVDNLKLQTNVIPAGAFGPEERRISFGNKYTTTAIADASQPIYNQSLLTGIKANVPNRELSELNMKQSRQTLIYNVANAYYQVIINQKKLDLLTKNQSRIAKLVKVSELQAEMGVAKKVDAKRVQVQLNNVNAQISVAQNNTDLAYNTLKNAMGLFSAEPIALSDTARWLNPQLPEAKAATFKQNGTLDFQIRETQIALYDLQATSIKTKALPVVSLFGQYGVNGFGKDVSTAFNRFFDYGSVGLRVTMPIFDGFKRNSQYRNALITRDNARLNQGLYQQSQLLQFQNAGSRVDRAKTTLATNLDNVNLATEVYDNTSLQYKNGVGTLSDLLNAENSFNDAQNNYIQSLIDYYLAQLEVEKANTTLEDYYNAL